MCNGFRITSQDHSVVDTVKFKIENIFLRISALEQGQSFIPLKKLQDQKCRGRWSQFSINSYIS